jgi:putative membrane-bound dehydrogenase-like protein
MPSQLIQRFIFAGSIIVSLLTCTPARSQATEPVVKAEDLPRVKPTEPANALKTFQVRPGFHIELVAAEPMVVDPIAMSFDENGRLFVIEMRDYPDRRSEKLGRIKLLEDTDGNGTFDKATVFLDHLPWPTALICTRGGILVGAAPDLMFAKDTNDDGVADDVKSLYTGFGNTQGEKLNVQGLFNSLNWGLDNRIHGCSGHDGGVITSALHPTTQPLDVRSSDFVLNPLDWSMQLESGGGQYGLSFDPFGARFTCSNSSHCEVYMYDSRYAARNASYTPPDPRISIAADGPAAEVFRISPEEPWRVIRTRWRVAGLVGGPVEGGGRSAGYFTGATGITIYRGSAFPKAYVGDAFVGDAGGNLIHHKRIRRHGLDYIAERPADEVKREFIASTDNWFRPVDFANAPDGTLYVADMYRETIEHPWSLPPNIKKFLDLNSGNDRGRIYRIVPDHYQQPEPPRLGQAMTSELVATLEHPNGWHRDTAQRLLVERQDKSAIPMLGEMVETSLSPLGRLHALHTLDGLGALTEAQAIKAMDDADPHLRADAVKLSEQFLSNGAASSGLWSKLQSLADDPDIVVRYQLAFTLGQISHPDRSAALAKIAARDIASPWARAAVLMSLNNGAADVFAALAQDKSLTATEPGKAFLTQLAQIIGGQSNERAIGAVADFARAAAGAKAALAFSVACGLAEGREQAAASTPLPALQSLLPLASQTIENSAAPLAARIKAASFLGYIDSPAAAGALLHLLDTDRGTSLRSAALSSLLRMKQTDSTGEILQRWSRLPPAIRIDAAAGLLTRPARAAALLAAVRTRSVPAADLSASQTNFLRNHPDAAVRALAQKILAPPATNRATLIQSFRPALSLAGDAAKGKRIYEQRCISCHRVGGGSASEGFAVGPDLVTVRNSGKEKLLINILDPNREVAANYIAYLVETKDGQSILGLIASDTPNSITLRQPYGRETIVPRGQIKRMSSEHKSLMPEGLEAGLKPQDVADLLQFVARN